MYDLNEVSIKIKDNIAIVKSGHRVTHKILSAKYYKYEDIRSFRDLKETNFAVLETNKGKIMIAENNEPYNIYNKTSYYFIIVKLQHNVYQFIG